MSDSSNSVVTRLVDRVFPRMPDFFGLLNEQCDLAAEAMDVFVQFMEKGDEELANRVRELEHHGDELKERNLDILNKAFSTPMDREDLYRAVMTIDHVVNYGKTTIREMEALGVKPDPYTLEMATCLKQGTESLQEGYRKLATNPAASEENAQAARKAERNTEKAYRRALAELFDFEKRAPQLELSEAHSSAEALGMILEIFKRREVYRHLSNASDRVARAGETLHDIVVKIS